MQRHRVHAVTQAGRRGAVFKHVAQVRITQVARNLIPLHAERTVGAFDDIDLGDGPPEAGPTRAGIKFRARVKQGGVAADAAVQPVRLVVIVFAGEGQLRAGLAGDVERGG